MGQIDETSTRDSIDGSNPASVAIHDHPKNPRPRIYSVLSEIEGST